jgi:hypothetical protein
MRPYNKNLKLASAVAAVLAGFVSVAAQAVSLPATSFTSTVFGGGTATGVCGVHTATDGICTATNGSFAHTDGGISGTPGYDPSASPGTHVSSGATGPGVGSFATMTYYFEVGGPAVAGGQIAVDIVSSGSAFLTGGTGFSFASLLITDAGSDADLAAGVPDPDQGRIVDSHYNGVGCLLGRCITTGAAWNQADQFHGDHLCLTQGDMYAIKITASSNVLSRGTSAGAAVDPKIIVDPQATDPASSCFQAPDPSIYGVSISGGASTGVGVPEPGTLGLMGLGLFGVGLGKRLRRRARAKV